MFFKSLLFSWKSSNFKYTNYYFFQCLHWVSCPYKVGIIKRISQRLSGRPELSPD